MKGHVISVDDATTDKAVATLRDKILQHDVGGNLVFAFHGCSHDGALVRDMLTNVLPGAAILGGTSSGGIMEGGGVLSSQSIGVLILSDADGEYGSAIRPKGNDPESAARDALIAALDAADCAGEIPDLVWIYQSPGHEEAVLRGLKSVIGEGCPIFGGSAADDTVEGNWTIMGPDAVMADGLVVAVLFPTGRIGLAFQGGYAPTQTNGEVSVDGGGVSRVITAIDGQPAARVYDGWTGGAITDKLGGGNVLGETTMFPLGLELGKADGVMQYLLIHPETVRDDGALTTFADIAEGTRLHCMTGDRDKLIERAGQVTGLALQDLDDATPAAAMIVYCGGCRLAVGDKVTGLPDTIAGVLGHAPFLGTFTFGEQGAVFDRSFHGNLMISAVVFGI